MASTQPCLPLNSDAAGAAFSPCGRYRYRLWRRWGRGERILWVMLNPSTADALTDDPTVRRCIAFSKAWGFGALDVCNLFAWRATDPRVLRRAEDPVGRVNDATIHSTAQACTTIVAAWGVHGALLERDQRVLELLADRRVQCLGVTQHRHPRHPLYVWGGERLVDLRGYR